MADPKEGAPSSDAIGYGITSSGAVRTGLAARSWEVTRPALTPTPGSDFPPIDRLRWIVHSYSRI